jgi:SAM-dependent methyltransferase
VEVTLDRTQELLKHIAKGHRGIEIGPYHNPLAPRRRGFNSIVLDVFDTEELRHRAKEDPNIPDEHRALIEDVNLLGSATDIAALVSDQYGSEQFDYIISSHNFEHLPNPIKFLQGCEQILKPGAILSMAIPDKRYCFDFYRPVTELSEWLDAFHEVRTKPTPGQVFRQSAYFSLLNGQIAWSPQTAGSPVPMEGLEAAFSDWKTLVQANGETSYRDGHCSTFTPASFELLLADLRFLGLSRLETMEVLGPNGCEFYVHLRRASGNGYHQARDAFYRQRAGLMRKLAEEQATSMTLGPPASEGAVDARNGDNCPLPARKRNFVQRSWARVSRPSLPKTLAGRAS